MDQLSLFDAAPASARVEVAAAARIEPTLPDADARRRIQQDLDTNLLVEAGAGAGKTTEMVYRMVALVRSGRAQVSHIAAVTFTRKAAAELRERFQTALERELRSAVERGDDVIAERADRGLREIDRAFLGTIHAFCARLLRERPLDAGLDPAFRETLGAEELMLRRQFWHLHLERLAAEGDPMLVELREVGLAPHQLERLYNELTSQPDVEYPAAPSPRPDAAFLRRRIEVLLDRAELLVPDDEPSRGWDACQTTLRKLRFHRRVLGWNNDTHFLDVMSELRPSSFKVTKNRWPNGDAAKAVGVELGELFEDGGHADVMLKDWWAFRYPIALAFAQRAAHAYERERVRAGTLNFQDLLMFAARMLHSSPSARRELSERYRFLLVDEFQDTDPIQAEVLFLLASDEELDIFEDTPDVDAPSRPAFASWRHLTPRAGALFVVGDPKQSIYRFRRADMLLYQQVKRRFESFGAVVELVSNFRSGVPVEAMVNDIFREKFPERSTDEQAQFAPMRVRPREAPVQEGVFWYELDDHVNSRVDQLARQDSERVATYIAERIASGERPPGDFLLLTANTRHLARYASALEARSVPVQVTGAGVGGPDSIELDELRVLLRALADPGNAMLTLAVLVGLFFGLDWERLTRHAEQWSAADPDSSGNEDVRATSRRRAPFSFTADWSDAETEVEQALDRLRHFWLITREQPADIAVARIADELGLLPFAASGDLGATRAGALLFALDTVRAASLAGDASLAGAIAALDAALDEDESEAPLEPGRDDVVRVMNLHKAKGLEAPVVILTQPFGDYTHEETSHVRRDETGRALGYLTVRETRNRREVTLAQPSDWPEYAEIEARFARAEDDRLLYVAATRAGHELIVSLAENRSRSTWRDFYPWLRAHGTPLILPQATRVERIEAEIDVDAIVAEIDDATRGRATRAEPTYRVAPVTERKVEAAQAVPDVVQDADAPIVEGRGTEWGTVVHDALMEAGRGVSGERLREVCRNLLIAQDRDIDPETGQPVELDELMGVVAAVRASGLWQRAESAAVRLVEAPFAVSMSAAEYAAVVGDGASAATVAVELLDGRIDLVFREDGGWVIVDYKTDAAGERIPAELMRRYRGQLELYRAAWQSLTGEAVKETLLLFTATGAVSSS